MYDLLYEIPDEHTLLTLSPEQLGFKLIALMKARFAESPDLQMIMPSSARNELWLHKFEDPETPRYALRFKPLIDEHLARAFEALERDGYLVPPSNGNAQFGWRKLTKKACAIDGPQSFEHMRQLNQPAHEFLHPAIAKHWPHVQRGDFGTAIFKAFKAVEIAVREIAGPAKADYGVRMMSHAFNAMTGTVADMSKPAPQREALCSLFVGAIGTFKNENSHRQTSAESLAEAVEQLMLASTLMRMIDRARERIEAQSIRQ